MTRENIKYTALQVLLDTQILMEMNQITSVLSFWSRYGIMAYEVIIWRSAIKSCGNC